MPTNEALFGELINIEFNSAGFQDSLNELSSKYEKWLQDMGSQGVDIGQMFNAVDLTNLLSGLDTLNTAIQAIAGTVTSQLAESFTASDDASDKSTAKQISNLQKVADAKKKAAEEPTTVDPTLENYRTESRIASSAAQSYASQSASLVRDKNNSEAQGFTDTAAEKATNAALAYRKVQEAIEQADAASAEFYTQESQRFAKEAQEAKVASEQIIASARARFEELNALEIAAVENRAKNALAQTGRNSAFAQNSTRGTQDAEEIDATIKLTEVFADAKLQADQLKVAKESLSLAGMQDAAAQIEESAAYSKQLTSALKEHQGNSGAEQDTNLAEYNRQVSEAYAQREAIAKAELQQEQQFIKDFNAARVQSEKETQSQVDGLWKEYFANQKAELTQQEQQVNQLARSQEAAYRSSLKTNTTTDSERIIADITKIRKAYEELKTAADEASKASKLSGNSEAITYAEKASEAVATLKNQLGQALEASKTLNVSMAQGAKAAADEAEAAGKIAVELSKAASGSFEQSGISRFVNSLKSDIPELIGNVVRFQLAWGVVGAAVSAVGAALMAPIDAIKEGLDYLDKTQVTSDSIRAILMETVKYTGTFADNMKEASLDADAITQKIQTLAAQLNVSADAVKRMFAVFQTGGGGELTKSLSDSVELSAVFAKLLGDTGASANSLGRGIQEVNKLLQESDQSTGRLLVGLGLMPAQAAKMVEQAKIHHDLLQQLEPLFKPYLSALEQAELHHASLSNQLELTKNRVEGAFAGPILELWNQGLAAGNEWLKAHASSLIAIGKLVFDAVEGIVKLVVALSNASGATNLLHLGFVLIGGAIAEIVAMLNIAMHSTTVVLNLIDKLWSALDHPTDRSGWAAFTTAAKSAVDDITKYAKEQDSLFDTIIHGSGIKTSDEPSRLDRPIESRGPLPPKAKPVKNSDDALTQLREEYDAEKAAQEAHTRELTAGIDAAVKAQKMTVQEGAAAKIAALESEKKALDDLIAKYMQLAQAQSAANGGKAKPSAVQGFETRLGSDRTTLADNIQAQEDRDQGQSDAADVKDSQQRLQESLKATQDNARAEVQIVKQKVHDKEITESEGFEREAAIQAEAFKKDIAALEQEVEMYGKNSQAGAKAYAELQTTSNTYYTQHANDSSHFTDLLRTEAAAMEKLAEARKKTQVDQLKANVNTSKANGTNRIDLAQQEAQLSQVKANLVGDELAKAQQKLAKDQELYNQGQLTIQQLDAEKAKVEALAVAYQNAQTAASDAADKTSAGANALTKIFGTANPWSVGTTNSQGQMTDENGRVTHDPNAQGQQSSMTQTVSSLNTAFKFFDGSVNKIIQGFKQGGPLGGISAITGQISKALGNSLPGQIMGLVSGVAGLLSSIFTAEAAAIEANFARQMKETMVQYSEQNLTLSQTITALKKQEADFLSQESGTKGGKDQIKKLQPEYESQIASLEQQQKQILVSFEEQTGQLNLQNTALSSALSTWQQMNQQVTQYIQAGGSVAVAQQYMNQQLYQMQKTAQDGLVQGQQQAVNDALQLNQLLQQRYDLEVQYSKTVFGELNQDSLERRASNAVTTGVDIKQQTYQYAEQMQQINGTLQATQQKVALESQVYKIAQDTATLQNQSANLQLYALQQQLQTAQGYKAVLSGITQDASGNYQASSNLTQTIGAVTINLQNPTNVTPQQLSDAITQSIAYRGRYGNGTNLPRYNYGG